MRTLWVIVFLFLAASAAHSKDRYSNAQCTKIDKQIKRIHSEMRAGYSAKKGVRLADKLRDLQHKRAKHCR